MSNAQYWLDNWAAFDNFKKQHHKRLFLDNSETIKEAVALAPKGHPIFDSLFEAGGAFVYPIAESPNAPPEMLAKLAEAELAGASTYLLSDIVQNPSTPPETLHKIASKMVLEQFSEWRCRKLAQNPNTAPHTLATLTLSQDKETRQLAQERLKNRHLYQHPLKAPTGEST